MYGNQFNLVIQDLPKDTNIIFRGTGIRYNYLCFGAWTMLQASNGFINLYDHVFITMKSHEAALLIDQCVLNDFTKSHVRNIWTSTSSGTLSWSKRLTNSAVFLHSSCSKSWATRGPMRKSINISLDMCTTAKIMLLWLQWREVGDPCSAATAHLVWQSCCGCKDNKKKPSKPTPHFRLALHQPMMRQNPTELWPQHETLHKN